jgi:hypothetical protein
VKSVYINIENIEKSFRRKLLIRSFSESRGRMGSTHACLLD